MRSRPLPGGRPSAIRESCRKAATGHSRRYCQVRLLVRYRQYPTLPTESWGADIDRLGRQDKSGRRPLAWPELQAFVCTLVLEMAHGGYRRDHLRALTQRVEVDAKEIRIMGSKSALLRARSSPHQAQNRLCLECPVLYRSGALGEIRTPDPRNRNPIVEGSKP